MMALPLAHARWFADPAAEHDVRWDALLAPGPLMMLAAVAATAIAWRRLTAHVTAMETRRLRPLERLQPHAHRAAALALGASLVGLTATGRFWTPDVMVGDDPLTTLGAVAQGGLGAWLLTGRWPRGAAVGVTALAATVLAAHGPLLVIESAHVLGLAAFLALGVGGRTENGLVALRVGLGLGLIVVAFAEKLLVPGLTLDVLSTEPMLNVPAQLGLELSPATFTTIAGGVEVLLGALLLAAPPPRILALGIAVPFLATLPLFGGTELIGHLPIYAALAVLVAHGPGQVTSAKFRRPVLAAT
jgi:hypothetical protein